MYDSIFETVVRGSNTVFLDIPEDDYFLSYDDISRDSAQEIAEDYFKFKGRDGTPHVRDISYDVSTNRVKIEVAVDYHRKYKLEPYTVPDMLNLNRK